MPGILHNADLRVFSMTYQENLERLRRKQLERERLQEYRESLKHDRILNTIGAFALVFGVLVVSLYIAAVVRGTYAPHATNSAPVPARLVPGSTAAPR